MRRTAGTVLSAVIVALSSVAAQADVVMPEPTTCPVGSTASTCHGGPHCRPATCIDSSSCTSGTTCQEVKWCIGQIDCTGRWRFDALPPLQDSVEGSCESATCAKGTCQTIKVCTTEGSPQARGCSCSIADANDHAPAWIVLAAVALVLCRRRTLRVHGKL